MTWPRLMRAPTARKYLDGLDPLLELGVAPQFHKGEPFFDRLEIDRKLDADGGIAPPSGDDPESALQSWIARDGAAARRP